MRVLAASGGCTIANGVGELDGGPCVVEAETATVEDLTVAGSVQIGEAFAELDLLSVDGNGAEGRFP